MTMLSICLDTQGSVDRANEFAAKLKWLNSYNAFNSAAAFSKVSGFLAKQNRNT